eukprot:TRINITY_DN13178_c0_g1_i1.p1 TRINITY_DN13178_c0_g1~~TRINITY_DN13178_c0_g1_i1.p1  ORF type:complete len:288 (+),score=37.57 TRINITY_DN13178_c0_g1_i1:103-966(+)
MDLAPPTYSFHHLPHAYDLWGDASNPSMVVLIHSKKLNRLAWYKNIPPLLDEGHSVLAFDLPGFGQHRVSSLAEAHPRFYPRCLLSLLDFLEISQSVIVVGVALGGFCALPFALQYPERVRTLVLACSPGGLMTERIQKCKEEADLEDRSYPLVSDPYSHSHSQSLSEFLSDSEHSLSNNTDALLFRQIARLNDTMVAGTNFGPWMKAVALSERDLESFDVPTLVIAAELDLSWSIAAMKGVCDAIPNARMQVMAGVGHSAPFEDPVEFHNLLSAFLQPVAGDSPSV